LTGFTSGSGSEQDAVCDVPPRPGQLKSCFQGSQFSRIARATEVIDMSAVGSVINRGEMMDLRLVNDPILKVAEFMLPPSIPSSARGIFSSELAARMLAVGVEFEDILSHMVWTGNPLNNSANSGYMEYSGLELLVTETHTDVFTQTNCPSLASLIINSGNARVDQQAAQIFQWMTTMWRITNENADNMNMKPVTWKWVMPNATFRELTDYWPCVYASFKCGATALQVNNNTDAMAMREMSDKMYRGKYLTIDGEDIPVVVDSAMHQEWNQDDGNIPSGCMRSDIYLLPFTVKGGTEVLFMEYFDFQNGIGVAADLATEGRINPFLWTDGGMWLWTPSQTRWCFDWSVVGKQRLRLLAPQLAARLENIIVCPLKWERLPFHSDPSYFTNGGVTNMGSTGLPYAHAGRLD
jgi:hypothetical protein